MEDHWRRQLSERSSRTSELAPILVIFCSLTLLQEEIAELRVRPGDQALIERMTAATLDRVARAPITTNRTEPNRLASALATLACATPAAMIRLQRRTATEAREAR